MKPVYANAFAVRKVSNRDGEVVEITLDIIQKYMEMQISLTDDGIESVSIPAVSEVASVVMTRQSALSLRSLLDATLGEPG